MPKRKSTSVGIAAERSEKNTKDADQQGNEVTRKNDDLAARAASDENSSQNTDRRAKKNRAKNTDPQTTHGNEDSPAQILRQEATRLGSNLAEFVKAAWTVLEPVTPLSWNWHLDLICEYVTLIKEKKFKEKFGSECEGVIFNVPPRTMKSLLITVFFPVWVWTTDPARRWMFSSYAEKLSTQHSVLRRNVINSRWYQERWGDVFKFAKDQNLKTHYENSARGQMFATAMRSTATGMGGDVLVFDDPLNPEQAVSETERDGCNLKFDTTFRSRLNDPATGIKIIIMQRLHEGDLTGHVLSREAERWVHVKLPATAEHDEIWSFPVSGRSSTRKAGELLWPDRLSATQLASLKIGMGSWAFAGQYQQNPAPLEGGLIKKNWIRYYRELPERWDLMVQSWDCTFKGESASGGDTDFVAGQVWGKVEGKYYMLPYRTHARLDFGPTKNAIKAAHARFPRAHAILIEDKANGPAIISELRKEIAGIVPIEPEGGKLARAQSTSPLWEAGSILLPDPQVFNGRDDAHADVGMWLEQYIHNICTFPKSAHDDDMDATSQALIYIRHRMSAGIFDFYRRGHDQLQEADAGRQAKRGKRIAETHLTATAHHALRSGGQLMCSPKQYPEIRQALSDIVGGDGWSEEQKQRAAAELERLDQVMTWKECVIPS
jgi:predicted phage terminase large subunit-like protein